MARVLLKGGKVAYALADSISDNEVKCTCAGENPNCMYCDGLGIVRGRHTSPVLRRSEAQVIRRAAQESRSMKTTATNITSFKTAVLSNLDRLMPAHHCTIHFAEKYPCNRLPAGAMAFRTKHVLEQSKGRVVQLTWHNPVHCDLVVHQHTPLGIQRIDSQVSFDLAGQVVARSDSAPVIIQTPAPPARLRSQQGGDKNAGRAIKRYAGTIKVRDGREPEGRRPPVSDTPGTSSREPSDIRLGTDERHLDATCGTHVFREYGSARFGSMPSYDEFDE
jgi:hypothetical protein